MPKDVPPTAEEKAELDRLALEVLEAGPQPEKKKEAPAAEVSVDGNIAGGITQTRGIRERFEKDPAYRAQVGKDQLARKAARDASGAPKKE